MKPLSLAIQKIWPMLEFLKSKSNIKVKVTRSKILVPIKGLVIRITHMKYEPLSLAIQKIWPMLKFLKSGSNFKVKVTWSKMLVPIEKSSHKKHTYEI
jgi:hypothetical protein